MPTWFQCTECIFATNSPKAAQIHTDKTQHIIDDGELEEI